MENTIAFCHLGASRPLRTEKAGGVGSAKLLSRGKLPRSECGIESTRPIHSAEGKDPMAVQLCYVCMFNHPKKPEEQRPSYADCDRCKRPTCKGHGRDVDSDRFYCIRCLRELGHS